MAGIYGIIKFINERPTANWIVLFIALIVILPVLLQLVMRLVPGVDEPGNFWAVFMLIYAPTALFVIPGLTVKNKLLSYTFLSCLLTNVIFSGLITQRVIELLAFCK